MQEIGGEILNSLEFFTSQIVYMECRQNITYRNVFKSKPEIKQTEFPSNQFDSEILRENENNLFNIIFDIR